MSAWIIFSSKWTGWIVKNIFQRRGYIIDFQYDSNLSKLPNEGEAMNKQRGEDEMRGMHTDTTNKQWGEVEGGTCRSQSREHDDQIIQIQSKFHISWSWRSKTGPKTHSLCNTIIISALLICWRFTKITTDTKTTQKWVPQPHSSFPVILPAGPQNQPWAVTERDLRKNGFKANVQILLSKQKW